MKEGNYQGILLSNSYFDGTRCHFETDVMQRLGVKIDTRPGAAEPTVAFSYVQPRKAWRVPATKSVVFQVKKSFVSRMWKCFI